MKIEQLFQFISVVKHGSINKASFELYMSQSNLSRSIRLLEEELGGNLFVRRSHGISLTPFGAEVYEKASIVCSTYQQLGQLSVKKPKNTSYKMRISTHPLTFSEYAFTQVYKRYQEKNPQFSLVHQPISQSSYDVKIGLSDIGISMCTSSSQKTIRHLMKNYDLEYTPLALLPMVVLIGSRHPLALSGQKAVSLKALGKYTFAVGENQIDVPELLSILKIPSSILNSVQIDSKDALLNFLIETECYCLIPSAESCTVPLNRFGCKPVVTLPIVEKDRYFEIGWFKQKNKLLMPCCQEFVSELSSLLQKN